MMTELIEGEKEKGVQHDFHVYFQLEQLGK